MDENVARTIRSINSWDDLRQFETNARERERLTSDVIAAINERAAELGRALISEKTGLDVTDLSPAENKIVQAASEYVSVMKRQGKYPGRTFEQLRNRGLIDAAETAVCKGKPTQGFQTLVDADLEDLSYEQIVVDHADEFSPRAVWYSRRALGLGNASEFAPAHTHSDIQERTTKLVRWLQSEAEECNGLVPAFTNADAATSMGFNDPRSYGRVHGNIQSRVDFACYLCGLPPLGLAAIEPFALAWAQQNRDWPFPVAGMATAAQRHRWTAGEFDKILATTEHLPGRAHTSWNEALNTEAQKVKAWADGLARSAELGPTQAEGARPARNPIWTRDELILALDLYMRHRDSPPGKDSVEVKELSEFLNKLGRALGIPDAATYRNANGVYMKMMNFRRIDPSYTGDGKVGLTRGNKDEEVVWNLFSADAPRLAAVVSIIRSGVDQMEQGQLDSGPDEPGCVDAEEGRVYTHLHRFRERSRKLVDECKKSALKKYSRLCCAACGFDFAKTYGQAGYGLIDVHHTKPVHTLLEGEKTKLEDLALLCSNCHRVVHSTKRWKTVEEVKALLDAHVSSSANTGDQK